jgi:hypothetical protein
MGFEGATFIRGQKIKYAQKESFLGAKKIKLFENRTA